MATSNQDLHGNAPDTCDAALMLIDVINDLEFEGGAQLLEPALEAARNIAALVRRARETELPVIYANDNFGRWRSDFRQAVEHCLRDGVRGQAIAELLEPPQDDYFVLKPKHSAFYSTTLDLLLKHLETKQLILCGFATDSCVLMTAVDAHMRDLKIYVPADCVASISAADNGNALHYMLHALRADTGPSTALDLRLLAGGAKECSLK